MDTRHQRNNSKEFSGLSELADIFRTPFTECLYAKSSAAEFLSRFLKLFGRFLKTTPQLSLPTTLPSFATSYHSNLAFDIIAFIGALKNVLEGHRIPIEVWSTIVLTTVPQSDLVTGEFFRNHIQKNLGMKRIFLYKYILIQLWLSYISMMNLLLWKRL